MALHHARRAALALLLLLPWAPPTALARAPAGLAPALDGADTIVAFDLLVLADHAGDGRAEARGARRLLNAAHKRGLWPATLAVTNDSLRAMIAADPTLPTLLAELQPTVILLGEPGRRHGLVACAEFSALTGLVPAWGGGAVGDLLREDTALLAWSRDLDARGLVAAGGFIPPARLVAVPEGAAPGPTEAEPWLRAWDTARADAQGVPLQREDAHTALGDLARMAALAASVGLDPFVVPHLQDFLRADLRADRPPHRWSPTPLGVESSRLDGLLEADPEGTLARLGETAAILARQVLSRSPTDREVSARMAELRPSSRYRTTQVLAARYAGHPQVGHASLAEAERLLDALAAASPHAAVAPQLQSVNQDQWTHPAGERWAAAFGASPQTAGRIDEAELTELRRAFKRRDQRRRARQR